MQGIVIHACHAFSGCDTVSSFCGIGKKTVFDVWRSLPSLVTLFGCLSETPEAITDDCMGEIERFVVLLYSRTSQLLTVNAARKQLFSYGNRKLENLPPTRAAMYQHAKRASFQAGYIWGQALIANPVLVIGVGRRMQMENGHHCGQPFQKLPNNVENSSNVTARNAVLDTANAAKPF